MRQGREEVAALSRELLDLDCQRPLTPRLLRWANLSLVGIAGYAVFWLVVWAFEQGLWVGLAHLLLVAPLALFAALVLTRLLLELTLAVHDIRAHTMELGELPRKVSSWPAMRKLAALGELSGFTLSRTESQVATRVSHAQAREQSPGRRAP